MSDIEELKKQVEQTERQADQAKTKYELKQRLRIAKQKKKQYNPDILHKVMKRLME